jgi:hypothetical protein
LRVYEKRVLRRIFGPKREEVAGGWRRLHSGQIHNLCASQDIILVIKSKRKRRTGHVARMGDIRNIYKIWLENMKGRDHLEDLNEDGKIILEWNLGK